MPELLSNSESNSEINNVNQADGDPNSSDDDSSDGGDDDQSSSSSDEEIQVDPLYPFELS